MWKKINDNYSVSDTGIVKNTKTGHIKTPTKNKKNGYLYVDLYNGKQRIKRPVHRLVAAAFINNTDNKPTVDHIDGNRENNNVKNLRWGTYSEQNSRFNTGGVRCEPVKATHYKETRKKRGGGHVSFNNVDKIMYFDSVTDCARFFRCTAGNISLMIKNGNIGLRGKTRAWKLEYTNKIDR